MGKFYFLESVKALINPKQIASLFRNGETWAVSMANGSTYNVSEKEFIELFTLIYNREDKGLDKKDIELLAKLLTK